MAASYTLQEQQDHCRYLELLKAGFLNKYQTLAPNEKKIEDYDMIKAISSGAYGEVYLVRDKAIFTYHALKVVDKAMVVQKKHEKHLLLEKKILQSIDFPFVVTLDAAFKDNVYLYLLLPYIAGGDLFTYLQKYNSFSEDLSKFYSCQVILAIEYLHFCSIIHRDIKPENIMVTTTGYLKLCDFGLCKVLKKKTWSLCGTPEYLAPEVIVSKGYSYGVDWWAVGVLIFEMMVGNPPFISSDPNKLYEKILKCSYKFPDYMGMECKGIVRGLLQVDPGKRLGCLKGGVYDIKSHNWFSDISWSDILNQKVEVPFVPTCPAPGDTSNFPKIQAMKLKKMTKSVYDNEFKDF